MEAADPGGPMPEPPVKRGAIQQLVEEARTLDLPAQIVRVLPPLVILFAGAGLPAAGTAVLTALALGEVGRRKMREFSRAVEAELGVVEGHLRTRIEGLEEPVEEIGRRVDALHARLDDSRVEHLGRLFEEYMRGMDGEWLNWLRNAARGVASAQDDGEVGLVVAGLWSMTPMHIRELQRMTRGFNNEQAAGSRERDDNGSPRPACHAALLAAGFLVEEIVLRGSPKKELSVAPLGRAALRLLRVSDRGTPAGFEG